MPRVFFLCIVLLAFSSFAPRAFAAFEMPQNNLGLVGWWTMDRVASTTVIDSSGNGNNGTEVGGPTQVAGKIGQALSFNGSNQSITAPPVVNSGPFSVSFWIKSSVNNTDWMTIICKYYASVWEIRYYGATNNIVFTLSNNNTVVSKTSLTVGQWYHVVAVYDGTTAYLYVDGQLENSAAESYSSNSTDITIGKRTYAANNQQLGGALDDLRIYNRALTAAEVQTLYQSSLPAHIASSLNTLDLANGLVGWWTFDGSDISGTSVLDKSGSGNTGTMVNSPKLVAGHIGQALSFNGSSQYVNDGAVTPALPATYSVWFKYLSPGGAVFNYAGNGYGQYQGTLLSVGPTSIVVQTGSAQNICNGSWRRSYIYNPTTAGVWHHAVVVVSSGTSASLYLDGVLQSTTSITGTATTYAYGSGAQLWLGGTTNNGCGGASYYTGSIDDMRVYNRALSASEVQALYDLGKQSHIAATVNPTGLNAGLVGHWTFDGAHLSTTTAYDTSGQGNNGTLVGSPKPVAGKIGQALSFTGNAYVTIPTSSSLNITTTSVSLWEKIDSAHSGPYSWYEKGSDYNDKIFIGTNEIGIKEAGTWTAVTAPAALYDGKWHHLVAVIGSGGIYVYVDGKLSTSSAANADTSFFNGDATTIGYSPVGVSGDGPVDDVRVYNRALSASEVKELYALGH